mgnify:CR=1 FL=1
MNPNMDAYQATMIAEGVEEATREEQVEAWQFLVDTGIAWQLQGSFGRQARALIEAGIINGPVGIACPRRALQRTMKAMKAMKAERR